MGFDNTRVASNALFNTLNPNLTPNFRFELRQHLLSGFGFDPNLRWIRIARNNKEIDRCHVPAADHPDGFADREHLLGPGERLLQRDRAAARAGPRQQDAVRQSETGGRRDAGSAHRGAVAECRGHGHSKT